MALGKETGIPKIIPIRRESMKLARPARGAFSSTDKRASIFVAREQDRLPAPSGADSELLAGLRDGSPSAVDELLRQYQGKIFNLAMSILKNESDAEEAAQDVFMTVIRKADTFQGNSAFYSWIYRICVNTCLMRLRGKRRNETVSIEELDDWSKEVERDALNEELGQMIRKYTEKLSEKYRVVFVLSDVEGLSNEETAKILGLTVPAIKSRLHRARLYLREQLSHYLRNGSAGMTVRQRPESTNWTRLAASDIVDAEAERSYN
jgi:RNA polymerase sigma-70 factor (ECF subfamily)